MRTENVPGLAMSRSIGDSVAQSVGVIPDPGKHIILRILRTKSRLKGQVHSVSIRRCLGIHLKSRHDQDGGPILACKRS